MRDCLSQRRWSHAIKRWKGLGTASLASGCVTRLRVRSAFLSFTTLDHHLCEVDVTTARILVEGFSRVVAGGVRGVTEESLERVEVHRRARFIWVPHRVDILLSLVIPQLVVILESERISHVRILIEMQADSQSYSFSVESYLSVRLEARSRGAGAEWGWGESRSGGNKGEEGDDLVLQNETTFSWVMKCQSGSPTSKWHQERASSPKALTHNYARQHWLINIERRHQDHWKIKNRSNLPWLKRIWRKYETNVNWEAQRDLQKANVLTM